MFEDFKKHIESSLPVLSESKVLVACSGGLDSVALAHLMHQSELTFGLAHCNFKLRGTESDGDEQFVRMLGEKLGCEVFVRTFDILGYINENGGSVQMAARELRYAWFEELVRSEGFEYVLTAHHADDSLETFLINLSRGTGIDGLTGIPFQNEHIIRPLLPFSRKEILAFAEEQSLKWREDSSNLETKYLRNKIRHEIIPSLKELHSTFLKNVLQTQNHLQGINLMLQEHKNTIQQKLFINEDNIIKIRIKELAELNPINTYLFLLFSDYGFREISNLKELLNTSSGKQLYSKTHRLVKDREQLLLSAIVDLDTNQYLIDKDTVGLEHPFKMKISTVTSMGKPSKSNVYLDKEKLKYPLLIRKWQNGDYFYPFGMKGKKKVAKYLKDEKVDLLAKEAQWVLCSGDDIVWVVGKRADDRFKVTSTTKNILKITVS